MTFLTGDLDGHVLQLKQQYRNSLEVNQGKESYEEKEKREGGGRKGKNEAKKGGKKEGIEADREVRRDQQ